MKNHRIKVLYTLIALFIINFISAQNVYDTILNEYLFQLEDNFKIENGQSNLPVMPSFEHEGPSILIGGEFGGVMPMDIIYYNNKYYVYGYHRLLVVNSTTHDVIKSIDISNYGTTFPAYEGTRIAYDKKRLAINTNNGELYCVTEDFKVLSIDTNTDEIAQVIYQLPYQEYYSSCIIKYDERTNKILLIINQTPDKHRSNYFRFNGEANHALVTTRSLDMFTLSMVVNAERDRIYLSGLKYDGTKVLETRYQDNGGGLINSTSISSDGVGKMLYINDEANNIHKTVCFQIKTSEYPAADLPTYVINGDNDDVSTYYSDKLFTASTYYNNRYYAAYQGGYRVYDAQNDNLLADISVSNPSAETYTFDMMPNENGFIVCSFSNRSNYEILGGDGSYIINCSDNSFSFINDIPNAGNFVSVLNKINNEVVICSFYDGTIHFVNNQGQYESALMTGGNPRKVVYCSQENKVYSYDPKVGKIYINSLNSNYYSVLNLGYLNSSKIITKVLYDKFFNRIFIAIESETNNEIIVIDCQTDQIIPNLLFTNKTWIRNMYISENQKLYINTGLYPNTPNVEIFKLSDLSAISSFPVPFVNHPYYRAYYQTKNNGDIIMAIGNGNDEQNRVWIISDETNVIINNYIITNPLGLQYNALNNKVYTGSIHGDDPSKTINILDLNTGHTSQLTFDKLVYGMKYCEKGNYLAVFGNQAVISSVDYQPAKVYFVDGESDELITQFEVPNYSSSIKYNEENGDLYLLTPANMESDNGDNMDVWNFDKSNSYNSKVSLSTFEKNWFYYKSSPEQSCFNTVDNQLIIATSHHAKLNIIDCDVDKRKLNNTYNWISFPKLKRDETVNQEQASVDALDNIDPEPDYLTMQGWEWPEYNYVYKQPSGWIPDGNPSVKSTEGFKLNLHPSSASWLPYEGSRMQANYPIYVQSGVENWVGYFLPQPQSPLDALSDLLPDLEIARGHDWTLTNISSSPGNPVWVVEPDKAQVKYGDMIVVEVSANRNFTWFELGESGKDEIAQTEYFTYTEEADYTPLFVELDTTSAAVEIGAFVKDTCVGACVVETTDTLVLVKAYVDTNSDDTISFQQYDGTKSTGANKIDKYFVKDKQSGIKVQRSIKLNEKNKFYVVSFKNNNINTENTSNKKLEVKLIPNPVTKSSTINFSLTQKSNVNIKIYGIDGASYGSKQYNSLNKGFHSINIINEVLNSNKPKPGLYILQLTSDRGNANNKFIID